MNLGIPMSLKGAAKAVGAFIVLAVISAAALAGLASLAAMVSPSAAALIQKYSPVKFS